MSEDWRKAKVTPTFKHDKNEDPGNYSPVSLILIPRKDDGIINHGNYFQPHEGQESHQK